jgi:hypothetical protein
MPIQMVSKAATPTVAQPMMATALPDSFEPTIARIKKLHKGKAGISQRRLKISISLPPLGTFNRYLILFMIYTDT